MFVSGNFGDTTVAKKICFFVSIPNSHLVSSHLDTDMSLSTDVKEQLEEGRVDCQFGGESLIWQCRRYIETKSRQEHILENSVKQALGEQKGAMAELQSATAVLQNNVTIIFEFLQRLV